jgi:hypothetical protein
VHRELTRLTPGQAGLKPRPENKVPLVLRWRCAHCDQRADIGMGQGSTRCVRQQIGDAGERAVRQRWVDGWVNGWTGRRVGGWMTAAPHGRILFQAGSHHAFCCDVSGSGLHRSQSL